MNETKLKLQRQQLDNFLSSDEGKIALGALKVTKEDLLGALDALTTVFVSYDNIPDLTWAFLLNGLAQGARINGKGANPRSNLG